MNNNEWIDVTDKLPRNKNYKKFDVKVIVGSMTTETIEQTVLGKLYPAGFRFIVGDWQRVVSWKPHNTTKGE